MVKLWVVNAYPVILLARAGLFDLLRQLGPPVVIPEAAVWEIQRKGSADPAVRALAQASWLPVVDPGPTPAHLAALGLGAGETAVLNYAFANPESGVILDDRLARVAAASLGLTHQGTLAVIVFAKTLGLIPAARPVVEHLRQHGMRLSDMVMNRALAQVGE